MISLKQLPIGRTSLTVALSDIQDFLMDNPVNGSIPIWTNNKLQVSDTVIRQAIIGGGNF